MITATDPLFIGFISSLALSVVVSLFLLGYVWHRHSVPGAKPLMGALFAIFFWSTGYILEYTCTDLNIRLFFVNISYLGAVSVHLMLLLFALQYCGFDKFITKRNIILLSIIPAVTLLVVWTKQYHSLMYYDISLYTDGPFLLIMKQYGPWFWVDWIYNYLLITAAIAVLVYRLFQRPHLYTRQVVYIITMIAFPIAANLIFVLRLIPMPHVDWTPATFSVTTIFMALLIFNRQLLEIIPIARESLIDMMNEGFIVTDSNGYVVDFNESAKKISSTPGWLKIGEILPDMISKQLNLNFINIVEQNTEIAVYEKDRQHYYIVTISQLLTGGDSPGGYLFMFHNITERKHSENIMKHLAYYDQLTTLPNRYLFNDRAQIALEHALRYGKKLAILMMDLDDFKVVNDTLGHLAGDKVLQEAALRLSKAVRKVDTVSRFGGDEFIILLTELTDGKSIDRVISRIVHNMEAEYRYDGRSMKVDFSIGISIYPTDRDELGELIQCADTAMYNAKKLGHNRFSYYSTGLSGD